MTGQVSVIGALGFNAVDVDLAMSGDRLYAVNSEFGVRVDLHEIDVVTGASLSSFQVHANGDSIVSAEGLAQIGGQLKIGYSTQDDVFSNGLGDLALNGLVTNTQTGGLTLDFDGLGADPSTGTLYGVDVWPNGDQSRVDVYTTTTTSPLSVSNIQSISPSLFLNDVAVFGDMLYAIDNGSPKIHNINLLTSAFGSVDLDRTGTYGGLAKVNAVPEPSSLLLCGLVSAGLLMRRSRRRESKVPAYTA